MISASPLRQLLIEKDLDVPLLIKATGLSNITLLNLLKKGKASCKTIDVLCRALKCQPCDIIEFTKTKKEGHWEYMVTEEM